MIKVVVILLGVAVMILAMLYFQQVQHSRSVSEELTATSNEVAAARSETASVKTQMIERVAELETTITGVNTEKARVEARAGELQERVRMIGQDLQQEKNKAAAVEAERAKLLSQLATISNELTNVRGLSGDSQLTDAEARTWRERAANLEMEKALVERQLNDFEALKARIRIVKQHLSKQRIERWERQDQEDWLKGNRGVLYRNGRWQTNS